MAEDIKGDPVEGEVRNGDMLRLSWYVEQQETLCNNAAILDGVKIAADEDVTLAPGDKVALHEEDYVEYWICKQDWNKGNLYTEGLDDPGSYTQNFVKAENTAGYEGVKVVTSVLDVNDGGNISKNTKFGMRIGYWKYYTCIKEFSGNVMSENPKTFPENFMAGIPIGDALVSRGKWSFYCAGVWYGSYEVKRNYETDSVASTAWESRGVSYSRVGNAKNTEITGDEEEEECYLRLFLTSSRFMKEDSLTAGFPPEGNGNKLIVEGFRHDEMLEASVGEDGVPKWTRKNKVKIKLDDRRVVSNWSWSAFNWRYGYPMHAATMDKRLIFASTSRQPQSMFLSRTDDLTNYFISSGDSSAFTASLTTGTLNPICWLKEKKGTLLLGTSEAEWEFGPAGSTEGLSSTNNTAATHGFNGSANYTASIGTKNKVVYVQRGGTAVQEFGYDIQADGYMSHELNLFARHITEDHGGIIRGAMAGVPRCELLFILGDGQVAVCSYNDEQSVKGWGRWVTEGKVKDVCTVSNGNDADLIYFVTERVKKKEAAGQEGTDTAAEDGDEKEFNIEVMHPDNPYQDEGGRDYTSTVVTTGLNNLVEQQVAKEPALPMKVRLGRDFKNEAGAMQVSRDGVRWINIDRPAPVLKSGWHEFVARTGWAEEQKMGIRVKGDRSCKIICLQG